MGIIKRTCGGSPTERVRTEGGRSVGSTDDSGSAVADNSVEEKTLTIGPMMSLDISTLSVEIWEATDERRYKQLGRVDIVT